MTYGRLKNKVVDLHEVATGHVAIELGNPERARARATGAARRCAGGAEIAVGDCASYTCMPCDSSC